MDSLTEFISTSRIGRQVASEEWRGDQKQKVFGSEMMNEGKKINITIIRVSKHFCDKTNCTKVN
jgi:hypothetical protein